MAYVNKLNLLTEKAAEMDTLNIVRDMKRTLPLPPATEQLENNFKAFKINKEEIELMRGTAGLATATIEVLKSLSSTEDSDFEKINIIRTINLLIEVPAPLEKNAEYAEEMMNWHPEFISELMKIILSFINKTVDQEQLLRVHEKLLRNNAFKYRFDDIIHEGQVEFLQGLSANMKKGYFFHLKLEEELKKMSFDIIKQRIQKEKLEFNKEIESNINMIKAGVDKAYEINMRMIRMFLQYYAFLKWLMSK